MTFPYYASAEQIMRDRSELARKGIARGRSVVVLTYAGGVLFVAENTSRALHKVSEIYDRIGFAAVGKYNEFENLRRQGIRIADLRGYSYDRADVRARSLATSYATALGAAFTESPKPVEVELAVAEVGFAPGAEQLYRITYDGSIADEDTFIVMGGSTEAITASMRENYTRGAALGAAVGVAVRALGASPGPGAAADAGPRTLGVRDLEVAVLEAARPRRAFRRIRGDDLAALLPSAAAAADGEGAGGAGRPDETAGE